VNILITRDGQACLGDFGIAGAFKDFAYHDNKLETLRYMAPERLLGAPAMNGPSRESDVYSLAMTSFKVFPLLRTILLVDTIIPLPSGPHGDIAI
jgi:serine/threonine protein kinase